MIDQLKVVELASVLAGPAVGMFFAELGAQVIKIENERAGGDVTRQWRIKGESKDDVSSYFSCVNWKKEHLFLDLKNQKDLEQVYAFIKEADIVVSNFKKGSGEKYGLDPKSLHKINSSLLIATISGFKSNPIRTAYDVVIQAETGYMSINGEKNSPPLKMPIAFMDLLAAHQLKEGILVALLKQQISNKGYHISVDLESSAISTLANQASNWLMTSNVPTAIGSQHPNIAPYGDTFKTRDGKEIVLAIGTNNQFEKLLAILKLVPQKDFDENQKRVENRNELIKWLTNAFVLRDQEELIKEFIQREVPAGAVKSIDEVFESKLGKSMVLEETIHGQTTKRVKTIAFEVKELS